MSELNLTREQTKGQFLINKKRVLLKSKSMTINWDVININIHFIDMYNDLNISIQIILWRKIVNGLLTNKGPVLDQQKQNTCILPWLLDLLQTRNFVCTAHFLGLQLWCTIKLLIYSKRRCQGYILQIFGPNIYPKWAKKRHFFMLFEVLYPITSGGQ